MLLAYIRTFFLSVCLVACDSQAPLPPYHSPNPSTMQQINEFANIIEKIGNDVRQLDVPDELFAPDSFRAIYENPDFYLASATALVGRKNLSSHHKKIIGYAMQKLPPEQFVMFVSLIVDSVEQGITSIDVLESTAFAPLNWGRQSLINYYQQPTVQELLMRIVSMPKLSSVNKEYIHDDILTGKAKQDYLKYIEMIGRTVQE